jgi:predicted nucleotidyltransferase
MLDNFCYVLVGAGDTLYAFRNEARPDSDVDVSPDLGLFGYSRLRIHIREILRGADVVNRRTLKPLLREGILRDAISAF